MSSLRHLDAFWPLTSAIAGQSARFGAYWMEQLWNRGGATGGKPLALLVCENGLSSDKTVATSCHRLLGRQHGKEGVDGSSPSEGSAKALQRGCCINPGFAGVCRPGRHRRFTEHPLDPEVTGGCELPSL